MKQLIHKIYHFQVERFAENDHRTVRLANLLGFLGFCISSTYSLFYYVIMDAANAALYNEFFAICYLGYFYFISRGRLFPALLVIIITFLSQMFFLVVFFASSQSGFHYYYLLCGPTLYFFLKKERKKYIILFSAAALILFLACEMAGDRYAYLVLNDTHFNILHYSTIGIVFFLLLLITHTLRKEIDEREKKLEKATRNQTITNAELEKENMERKQAQKALEGEALKLQEALLEIKQLSGLFPICSSCKKIRDDQGYWNQIENYISQHSEARFSHGICPECQKKLYPDMF